MHTPRIVVVEEDDAIAEALVEVLRLDGYPTERMTAGPAWKRLEAAGTDLLVVDLDPVTPGVASLCAAARSTPVVVLALAPGDAAAAARRAEELGADDCVRKPFALADLRARVRSHLRRDVVTDERIVVGDIEMDRVTRRVWQRGREIDVRPREFDLLALLLEHSGGALSRRRIMREVWDAQATNVTKSVDVHVSSLRRKLGDTGATRIVTVRGVGYCYDPSQSVVRSGPRALRTASAPEDAPPSTRPSRA